MSPTGAFTYDLPIQVSPGSSGLQPKLSISYNSQSGNGILGYGWNLGGISSISRVSKNIYYNGVFAPVTLTSNDVFALDGQRLIGTDVNIYAPENNPYIKVVFNGSYFTVTSQDGMVMEYGNTTGNNSNSLFYGVNGTVPVSYAINRITSPDGNYMDFIYAGDKTSGEYRISEINYTGNGTSIVPYNSVKFYYDKRTDIIVNNLLLH